MRFQELRTRVRLPRLSLSSAAISACQGVVIGAAVAVLAFPVRTWLWPAPAAMPSPAAAVPQTAPQVAAVRPRFADFGGEDASPDARHVADWVADSRDNGNSDFVIVDKKFAKVYVFGSDARLRGATPVLLGAAPGDDSVPGIGARAIEDIRNEERTTPAGRFLAQRGRNTTNEDVVWIDYGAAVSMHRVRATDPRERRMERLASATVEDNRISWGCINVPAAFFEGFVQPVFADRKALVYVLPEVKTVREVFGSYDVAQVHGTVASGALPAADRSW